MINLIVAIDKNNAIGYSDGRLPWKLSKDMARFKELTTSGENPTVVMGFKTFKSLNRPMGLPNRTNVVLSRLPRTVHSSIQVIHSMEEIKNIKSDNIWIIGGADIYQQAMSLGIVDRIFLTDVECYSDGDIKFELDTTGYKLINEETPEIVYSKLEPPVKITFKTYSK